MKKIVIALSIVVLIVAALPIVGNKVMQTAVDDRVMELHSYGLKSINIETDAGYLSTKKHFEFLLEDADVFVEYLNEYADGQVPPYVNAMLEGVLIGVDLKYCNIPFSKSLELDIYPLKMSPSMADDLKKDNMAFYEYLEKFLHSKGILYHISYNIVSQDFEGYVKDIQESYTLEDASQLQLTLKSINYNGNGELMAPNALKTSVKELRLEIVDDKEYVIFDLKDLQTQASYESQSTYLTSVNLNNFDFVVSGTSEDINFKLEEIMLNFSSNTQGEFAEIDSKSSIENFELTSDELNIDYKKLNMDVALGQMEKESFKKSLALASKANNLSSAQLEKELRESLLELVSHGLVFRVADFSVEDIVLEKNEDLKGLSLQSEIKLKADKEFVQKLNISPLLLIENLDVMAKLKVSSQIFEKLAQNQAEAQMLQEYIKKDGNDYIFDFLFKDGEATLNNKALR